VLAGRLDLEDAASIREDMLAALSQTDGD